MARPPADARRRESAALVDGEALPTRTAGRAKRAFALDGWPPRPEPGLG